MKSNLEIVDCGGVELKASDEDKIREKERKDFSYLGEPSDDDMPFMPLGG